MSRSRALPWRSRYQAVVEKPDGTETLDGFDLTLMRIPAGTFLMGVPKGEAEIGKLKRPVHPVALQAFLLGRTPITQAQWGLVASWQPLDGELPWEMELNPDPSGFRGDQRPVEQVSWKEAMEFCRRLFKHTDRSYALPSEGRWEHTCRAVTTTTFHFAAMISPDLANYDASIS